MITGREKAVINLYTELVNRGVTGIDRGQLRNEIIKKILLYIKEKLNVSSLYKIEIECFQFT